MTGWLYTLFALSLFCPLYTYVVYPLLLLLFRQRTFRQNDDFLPSVSVIVVGTPSEGTRRKSADIQRCGYPRLEVIPANDLVAGAQSAAGDILVFTAPHTRLDPSAVFEIVKPFADESVGCVVGQQTNPAGNSLFWKYENWVRAREGRMGCVSGANDSVFAIRKRSMPVVPPFVLNKPFYLATSIAQNGGACVYRPTAKAYESTKPGADFGGHVRMAAGYWQAMRLFPRMFFPGKAAFVYIGHRVMKCFVWLDMLFMLVACGLLAGHSRCMAALFVGQLVLYLFLGLMRPAQRPRGLARIVAVGRYFLLLNFAYFAGLFLKPAFTETRT